MRSSNNFAAQVKRLTSPGEKEKEEQAEMLLWAEEREMRKKAEEGKGARVMRHEKYFTLTLWFNVNN